MLHFQSPHLGHPSVWGLRVAEIHVDPEYELNRALATTSWLSMPGQYTGGIGIYRSATGQPLDIVFSGAYVYDAYASSFLYTSGAYLYNIEPGIATATLVHGGVYNVTASVTPSFVNGAVLTLTSPYVVSAFTGAQAALVAPAATLTSTGTVQATARAVLTLTGAYTVVSSGTVGRNAQAVLVHGGSYVVTAQTGAQVELALQPYGYVVVAGGLTGGTASAVLTLTGSYTIASGATTEGRATAVLVGPALRMAPTGSAWLVGPSLRMYATGGPVVSVTYEAYAINLTTGVVTHYTNYPFDNILRFGDKYYGVKSDGLFEIGGSLDLTAAIDAHIKTFSTTFSDRKMKRLPYVYSSGRSNGGVKVGVTADEGTMYEYESDWGEIAGSTNHRTKVGNGIRGVYYSIDVSNINGSSLELDSIDVVTEQTTRAI